MTPQAMQWAAFEKYRGADSRSIVERGALDIENQPGFEHVLLRYTLLDQRPVYDI
jgi:hypothetical protein